MISQLIDWRPSRDETIRGFSDDQAGILSTETETMFGHGGEGMRTWLAMHDIERDLRVPIRKVAGWG
ncbi:MAG: hypothetical protein R2839_05695 [Thermomicrobiales bacterium]